MQGAQVGCPTTSRKEKLMGDITTLTAEERRMRERLMRHIPTEFPEGDWRTTVDTVAFINSFFEVIPHEWLIFIPNQLTQLIWDCPGQVDGEHTVHYLPDLGYGRGDAVSLQEEKWLVIYQDKQSTSEGKFYCVVV